MNAIKDLLYKLSGIKVFMKKCAKFVCDIEDER